jgi:phosphoglycolate phosphatase
VVIEHLLCDLDGTLVDSADSILSSLRRSLISAGVPVRLPFPAELLRMPLDALLQSVLKPDHISALAAVEMEFRRDYDERGYLSARAYPGMPEALRVLVDEGVNMHIVTNKRRVPTLSILQALGWTDTFATISTLDSTPGALDKTDVVRQLLGTLRVPASSTFLIGDSIDDAAAARVNGVGFGWASWGYGSDLSLNMGDMKLAGAEDLIGHVRGVRAN